MYTLNETQLTVQLDTIIDRIQQIRKLDLASETSRKQALVASRDTLGALALYRKQLNRAIAHKPIAPRHAA